MKQLTDEVFAQVRDALASARVYMNHVAVANWQTPAVICSEALAALTAAKQAQPDSFQERVALWMLECFGQEIADDADERNHRFLEEALELVQACGCTQSEAHQLVDYVYGRPVGEKGQEVGGVMVTLAALCLAQKLDMHECGETELARIWTKVESIRAKQAAKPKHSPLPEHPAKQAQPEPVNAMLVEALEAAEKLEHEALVALSEATYELKVGNTYTMATDTYKANNDLIHRLDKVLNSQYRDRKRAALTAAQQAQPVPATAQVGEDGDGQENHCPDCGAEPGQMCSSIEGTEWGRRVHVARQQAQPERAPLDKDTIAEIAHHMEAEDCDDSFWVEFTRAIEAHHGIKQGGQHD